MQSFVFQTACYICNIDLCVALILDKVLCSSRNCITKHGYYVVWNKHIKREVKKKDSKQSWVALSLWCCIVYFVCVHVMISYAKDLHYFDFSFVQVSFPFSSIPFFFFFFCLYFLAHPVRRTRWAYAMVWRPSVRPQFSKCFFFVISQPILILIVS